MADLKKLRSDYEAAEAKAHGIQADRDEAFAKVRERFDDKLRAAVDAAAAAQKKWMDAEAAATLAERYEGDELRQRADALGLTLPDA